MSITPIPCSDDELEGALLAYQEAITQVLIDARPLIDDLQAASKDLDNQLLVPLRKSIDDVFNSLGISTDEFIEASGMQYGGTQAEMEDSLTKMGLPISNGRVLVPGDLDLTAVRTLTRLTGSFDEVKRLLANYNFPIGSDTKTPTAFLFVVTYNKYEVVKPDICREEYTKSTETLLGINKSVSRILADNPTLGRDDLIFYIFWLGTPEASGRIRDQFDEYGLGQEDFIDAVTKPAQVIEDPAKVWEVILKYGDDTEDVIRKVPRLEVVPTATDIIGTIMPVIRRKPGRSNDTGATDYGIPAVNLISTINFEKTFGSDKSSDCIDASLDLSSVVGTLFNAIGAASRVLNSLLAEAAQAFAGTLNKLTGLFGCVDNMLLRMASCFFKGITITLPLEFKAALDNIFKMIEGGLKLFERFFHLTAALLNIAAPLGCIKASIAGIARLAGVNIPNIPGLACVARLISFDICLQAEVNIGQIEADLAMNAIQIALGQLRQCLSMLLSLTIGLNDSLQITEPGCLMPEAAILIGKLTIRAAQVSAGLPL